MYVVFKFKMYLNNFLKYFLLYIMGVFDFVISLILCEKFVKFFGMYYQLIKI